MAKTPTALTAPLEIVTDSYRDEHRNSNEESPGADCDSANWASQRVPVGLGAAGQALGRPGAAVVELRVGPAMKVMAPLITRR